MPRQPAAITQADVAQALRIEKRERRADRKALAELSAAVTTALNAIDTVMNQPESAERGARIAKIANFLDVANDKVRYFRLGVDWRKDKKGQP